MVNEIDERLAVVMQKDSADQAALEVARSESRRRLTTVDTGQVARRAYMAGGGTNRYADERG